MCAEKTDDRPLTEQGMPETYPADEPKVGTMAAHAEAMQVVAELLVDVDDEIAKRIINALDIMGSAMVELSQRSTGDPVDNAMVNNCHFMQGAIDKALAPAEEGGTP